jgi:hypothetical protein
MVIALIGLYKVSLEKGKAAGIQALVENLNPAANSDGMLGSLRQALASSKINPGVNQVVDHRLEGVLSFPQLLCFSIASG